jgi:tRNA (guanine37-N1)-methyltransferase
MVNAIIFESILGKAEKKELVKYCVKNLFDFADLPHSRIDDYPFGGSSGMVLKPEPIFRAYDSVLNDLNGASSFKVIFPTPDGKLLDQNLAKDLSKENNLIFISGHYKGIDQRVRDELVTDEISIGDYVLTGGELPSLIILDSIIRLIPGVLNNYESAKTDSFSNLLLDCPYYTRPGEFRKLKVPSVLLSGNHQNIDEWKKKESEHKTKIRRPDLWEKYNRLEDGKNNG